MSFLQVMEIVTTRTAELEELEEQWRAATEGERTTSRSIIALDRSQPGHYVVVVEFPSYEEAMRNNKLPQTQEFARRMAELCDGPIRYVDADVVRTHED